MELKKAIEILKKNREECVPYSAFGGDNREQLSVMIKVLENNWSRKDVYEIYEEMGDIIGSALLAIDLRENNFEDIHEYLYPVKS